MDFVQLCYVMSESYLIYVGMRCVAVRKSPPWGSELGLGVRGRNPSSPNPSNPNPSNLNPSNPNPNPKGGDFSQGGYFQGEFFRRGLFRGVLFLEPDVCPISVQPSLYLLKIYFNTRNGHNPENSWNLTFCIVLSFNNIIFISNSIKYIVYI